MKRAGGDCGRDLQGYGITCKDQMVALDDSWGVSEDSSTGDMTVMENWIGGI